MTHKTRQQDHELYSTWSGIKQRCYNPNAAHYDRYGGRGITMHDPWRHDFPVFAEWVESNLGPRPEGHTFDRIDNDKGYEPGNLKWSTQYEQIQNRQPKANSLGYPGVKRRERNGRVFYVARIVIDGKRRDLGQRKTAYEAYLLYKAAHDELMAELGIKVKAKKTRRRVRMRRAA